MLELETIVAPLAAGYKRLQSDTFQTCAQITTERRINPDEAIREDLRSRSFYTNNISVYKVEKLRVVLHFGKMDGNFFEDMEEVCRQLSECDNYKLGEKERINLFESVGYEYIKLDLKNLKLKWFKEEYGYFEIDTEKHYQLNPSRRLLANAVFDENNFKENMDMLRENRINKVRIYTLMPSYVQEKAKQGPFARAGWLNCLGMNSNFNAANNDVKNDNSIRGLIER